MTERDAPATPGSLQDTRFLTLERDEGPDSRYVVIRDIAGTEIGRVPIEECSYAFECHFPYDVCRPLAITVDNLEMVAVCMQLVALFDDDKEYPPSLHVVSPYFEEIYTLVRVVMGGDRVQELERSQQLRFSGPLVPPPPAG